MIIERRPRENCPRDARRSLTTRVQRSRPKPQGRGGRVFYLKESARRKKGKTKQTAGQPSADDRGPNGGACAAARDMLKQKRIVL